MFPFLFGLYQFINAFNRNTPSIIKNIGTIKQGLSLIVVDDALVRRLQGWCTRHLKVSILVVLDDALVQVVTVSRTLPPDCLNPCCAGRCSSTTRYAFNIAKEYVSILVVLDDALVLERQRLY